MHGLTTPWHKKICNTKETYPPVTTASINTLQTPNEFFKQKPLRTTFTRFTHPSCKLSSRTTGTQTRDLLLTGQTRVSLRYNLVPTYCGANMTSPQLACTYRQLTQLKVGLRPQRIVGFAIFLVNLQSVFSGV